jgi:hypothetical protein
MIYSDVKWPTKPTWLMVLREGEHRFPNIIINLFFQIIASSKLGSIYFPHLTIIFAVSMVDLNRAYQTCEFHWISIVDLCTSKRPLAPWEIFMPGREIDGLHTAQEGQTQKMRATAVHSARCVTPTVRPEGWPRFTSIQKLRELDSGQEYTMEWHWMANS